MKPWRLQTRLLLLILAPLTLLVFTLGFSTVLARFQGLETVKDQEARILLAKYHFAFDRLREVTPTSLQALALAALEEPGLRSISLLDSQGQILLHSGPQLRPLNEGESLKLNAQTHRHVTSRSWIYTQPLASPIPDNDYHLRQAWVALELATQEVTLQKYEALLFVGLLCLGILVATAFLIIFFLNKWLTPIGEIAEGLRKIDSTHLNRHLHTEASGDLLLLENEINNLLDRISRSTEELQSSMMQANEDLRETMEVMEVQNIELTLARKEAVEGNRIKSEFLANISHEIRTPLNGIMGFAKLLIKTSVSPRQADYIKTIQKSADSLLAIINDVLDLSKIEAGKLVLDHSPMDIEEIVFDVLGMLAPLAEEKNLEQVAFIYDDVPLHLMGDSLRLKQILTNLINNAIKFTPEGEVVVRCMLESQTERHATLRFSVSDTGIGVSENARSDLFRAFSQGDPSTTRKYGGTGLGLVICRHLVGLMHGEISFESNESGGTTFWFTLRAELDNTSAQPAPVQFAGDKRVIVAEPRSTTRKLLTHTLEHWNIKSQGVDALEPLYNLLREEGSPDAIIIDSTLLGIRESMTSLQLSELCRLASCPVLLVTRNSDMEPGNNGYPKFLFATISRPIIPRELRQQLSHLFSGNTSAISQPQLLSASQQPFKVLAVDDNPANLKLVCTLLHELNVEVTPASDGYQAIRFCKEREFDLVFMDIQMPGMSGLETTQLIRQYEQENGIEKVVPIIALTAHAMANEKEALLNAGMNDYLTKPVQDFQLTHMLQKWAGQESPANKEAPQLSSVSSPASSTATVVVDWEECIKLAAGKPDLARDMMIMLFNSLEQEKRKISDAYGDNNMDALLNHVHYLHGATRYCGVPALRSAAHATETAIKSRLQEYQQKVESGSATEALRTDSVSNDLGVLLTCIDELNEWHRNNALPS